ncbi:MAG: hypothetical protein KHY88_05630 [Erysipelotrichaceae bacterium]|nr:hypothetical protein [Erysipelotrichaceae bacterium]
MEMDGLIVDFDGIRNIIMYHGLKEYPIGGLVAEYARLHPTDLKEVILSYKGLDNYPSTDTIADFFPWFVDELESRFGIVTAVMVTFEFMDFVAMVLKKDYKDLTEYFKEISNEDSVGQYIFDGSGFNSTGSSTNKQLLLSAYYWWAQSYVAFKHSFLMLASENKYDENQVMAFWSMFSENIDFQHIDFRIANYEGKFHSLYTIKSSMSLILFEAAHCLDNDVKFVKCENCGEYFVPEGRNDAIYCGYPSLQDKNKTCKEIGAQVTRANKEKNDIATKEYRRVYMKYKMITLRHPENREAIRIFEKLTSEVKILRKKLKNGTITTEDFLKWLNRF